jgi:hypothetical protein
MEWGMARELRMTVVTIAERPDLTYSISVGETLSHESVERPHLKNYLARYGILDAKYDDVIRQLAGKGKTSVGIPLGKFAQI